KMLVLKWTSVATAISHQNKTLNEECKSLCEEFRHDGVASVVIKGQSNLENYPEELRWYRTPGDIDLWCQARNGVEIGKVVNGEVVKSEFHGIAGVIEYCKQYERCRGRDIPWHRVLYYHCELKSDNVIAIEPHYRISYLHSPVRNHRLQKWFQEQFDVCLKNNCQLGFPVLTPSVNVVYQLVHLYRHVFEGGVGLRQLMDYYFALRVWHNDVMECKDLQSQGMWSEGLGTPVMSKEEVMAVIRSFGMGKFAGAVMWVLKEVFFKNEETTFGGRRESQCRMKKQRSAAEGKANEECTEADDGGERELSGINRELKEMGPQADDMGEQQLFTHCKYKEEFIKLKQVSSIGQQLKEKCVCEPWMICAPNEKEGRKLLEEIMKGGNFGQYDERGKEFKNGGMIKHGLWKLKRVMRLVRSYPEEAMWEPMFRVYHLIWRLIH
ncbi:MAG: nucleotidyltransferase family protein, partial [Prevotella sp.]|nr:nucleotidyltransferase family protein [Prevotella sp.]